MRLALPFRCDVDVLSLTAHVLSVCCQGCEKMKSKLENIPGSVSWFITSLDWPESLAASEKAISEISAPPCETILDSRHCSLHGAHVTDKFESIVTP